MIQEAAVMSLDRRGLYIEKTIHLLSRLRQLHGNPLVVKRNLATIHAAGAMLCLALGLAGCASEAPQVQTAPPAEAAYLPDPSDPLSRWVPHIREASQKYDMPEKWIRAVMMRESNGRATTNSGKVLTSSAGAIGLMQVMPGTYELMRTQYGLGADPSDPHDNIMAGTAYLREMYDLFGAPGFLAAYIAA
ncbi:lytic transglycosylase domain-containing protein, partial [Azospirillum sp. B506]|uniref:lytic transglycosylase domain-containing protein n=1 Tax=Azospirillum sp. B506 TaxID=137721 RepID=UPI0035D48904